MKKFDELFNKIILETSENIEEAPLTDEEKGILKTMLEKVFEGMSPTSIIQAAHMAVRDFRFPFKHSGGEKDTDQYNKAVDYLEKFIDSPFADNEGTQYNEIKQMFVDYCLENEDAADKVTSKRAWIMKGVVLTKALEAKLGEKFGFDGTDVR